MFLFVSMPYAKFDSRWFANVPNVNLGILEPYLVRQGRAAKTFHFHLDFIPFLEKLNPSIKDHFVQLAQPFGVEFLGLDYVFASLFFRERYEASRDRFAQRLDAVGLTLEDFERLREAAGTFVDYAYAKLSPYLPDTGLVGFTCSHYQLSGSLLLCGKMKESHPRLRSVFGGKDCSGAFSRELLSRTKIVDFVGTSECEVTIASLLEHLEDPDKPLCNLLFRSPSGEIQEAEERSNVSFVDLPFPAYGFEGIPLSKKELILPLELGRGCPWGKCTFCPDESYGVKCQSKTIGQVRGEIDSYRAFSEDLKNFIILDPDALKDPDLVIQLADYLEDKNLSFHFAEFRAERMDRRVLKSLLRFGKWASHFQVGIESFSDGILRLMNKGVTVLRNVEVLKMVAELGVPLQFNLFTCYPNMRPSHLEESLRVMDAIAHVLVCENIQVFPGEFYLPTDCPVFVETDGCGLRRNEESVFADVFYDFPMCSYSNYPYPYDFDNSEEQYRFSTAIREKVREIKNLDPRRNFMTWEKDSDGLRIEMGQNGRIMTHKLGTQEASIYLAAVEASQQVKGVAAALGRSAGEVHRVLDEFEEKGLILYAPDRRSYLSLAMRKLEG